MQIVGKAGKGGFGKWFKLFCSQVGHNKKLNALHLTVSGCRLTGTEAACLAVLTNLTSLDISYNQLGVAGAQALAVLTGLTSLNIGCNQLGDAGAQALAVLTGPHVAGYQCESKVETTALSSGSQPLNPSFPRFLAGTQRRSLFRQDACFGMITNYFLRFFAY